MSTWAPEHDSDLLNIQQNVAMKHNDVVKMVTAHCMCKSFIDNIQIIIYHLSH